MKHKLMTLIPVAVLMVCNIAAGQVHNDAPTNADKAFKPMSIEINAGEINIKTTINADGEVQVTSLKPGESKMTATEAMEALSVISVFLYGGAVDKGDFHMHTEGLMKKYMDYRGGYYDYKEQDQIMMKFMDAVKVANVDDLIKLMKQTSWNRDKAANQPAMEPAQPKPIQLPTNPHGTVKY